MKLILHIGTEKTGTTSIQSFLKLNKEQLNKQNIFIPSSLFQLPSGNQRWITTFALEEDTEDEFYNSIGSNVRERKNLIRTKLNIFRKEVSENQKRTCIISSEHLSSRCEDIKTISRSKALLDKLFDDIFVLIYIRRPIDGATSSLSTALRAGEILKGLDLEFLTKHINNLKIIKL